MIDLYSGGPETARERFFFWRRLACPIGSSRSTSAPSVEPDDAAVFADFCQRPGIGPSNRRMTSRWAAGAPISIFRISARSWMYLAGEAPGNYGSGRRTLAANNSSCPNG